MYDAKVKSVAAAAPVLATAGYEPDPESSDFMRTLAVKIWLAATG